MPAACRSLFVLLVVAGIASASPRDELLRFVPDDAGLVFVVHDLRGQSANLAKSPFLEQLRDSPLGKTVTGAAEVRELLKFEKQLKDMVGLSAAELLDDVFGDAIVFAYQPGPPGKPELEQGLILLRARDAKPLGTLVDKLNTFLKAAGQLKELEPREHKGVKYFRRVEQKENSYYFVRGPILVLSGQEAMLKRAIEQEAAAKDAKPALTARLEEVGLDKALATLWLNPRAFDAEMEAKIKNAKGDAAAVLKAMQTYWKALDGVGAALTLDKDLRLSVAVQAKTEKLPQAARRFLESAGKPGALWPRFPDNALFAVGGRLDLAALVEMLGQFLTPGGREALTKDLNRGPGAVLGLDFLKDVLPHIGPDWGLCVTAPEAKDKGWFPQITFAVRVARGGGLIPVDEGLFDGLKIFAAAAVLGHNKQHPDRPLSLKTDGRGKKEIKYLAGDKVFPVGVQPAMSLAGGYLVLAGSRDLVRQFAAAPDQTPRDGAEAPLLRASLKDLRAYLLDRHEALAAVVAEGNQLTKDDAGKRLASLAAGLEFFDRLDLSVKSGKGHAVLTLRVQTSKPLKP